MQKLLLIGLGGFLGSIARYTASVAIGARLGSRFAYGTFVVNMTGCLLIGFALAILNERSGLSPSWRFFFPIGFVGAYTTFSTFEWETLSSVHAGDWNIALLYVASSVIVGFFAVWLGLQLGRLFA